MTVQTLDRVRPIEDGIIPDPMAFRTVCGNFATGVTIVTTDSPTGPKGGTVNAFTSLSVDPPQVIVCLNKSSATWRAIEESGVFTVNILSSDQRDVARQFASKVEDKFAAVGWERGIHGAPVLTGTVGTIECTLVEALPQATHMLLIGSVVHAVVDVDKDPLVFFRSTMHSGINLANAS